MIYDELRLAIINDVLNLLYLNETYIKKIVPKVEEFKKEIESRKYDPVSIYWKHHVN
uniref:Uncharacterized protein n=1 Tax=viral metagenome TaxID=1070528 RepID=A0A6M3IZV1_9ZZZZ